MEVGRFREGKPGDQQHAGKRHRLGDPMLRRDSVGAFHNIWLRKQSMIVAKIGIKSQCMGCVGMVWCGYGWNTIFQGGSYDSCLAIRWFHPRMLRL